MPNVVVFKETILPPSETFILAQMRSLTKFVPYLAGLEPTRKTLSLDQPPTLLSQSVSRFSDLRAKVYRRTGVAPRYHHRLQQLQPDLLHAHFASGGKTLLPLQRQLQVPLIVTLHGGSCVPVDPPRRGEYRALAEQGTLFLCVSDFIRRQAIAAGYPEQKLTTHFIGIDRALFRPPVERIDTSTVLFVGRLVEMKGCEYLIRAMAKVQALQPASELIIVGDGPLRPSLEELARELGVRCRFLGVQPPESIRGWLQQSRLLSLPSVTTADGHIEGLGMVLLEAQSMGVPVVGTLHAGIQEAISDGVTGILVPERNPEELAQAVLRLLEDPMLWQRYSEAAQKFVEERFDLHRQTARLEELYAEQVERWH